MTYARINSDLPPESPGFLGGYVLEQVGHPATLTLSLWKDSTELEVVDDWSGPAAGAEPVVALFLTFDGPLSPAAYDAARFAARERVQPALAGVPGHIRLLALWRPDTRSVTVVHLAVSMDALEDAGRAVRSTELLPGEDPALLPGPDRAVAYRVTNVVGRPA
jgi:hypothetical protein